MLLKERCGLLLQIQIQIPHEHILTKAYKVLGRKTTTNLSILRRLAPMWQQSGTLLFCSCHGIAGFLVDGLQIWIWRHFLEVLPDITLISFSKKNESSLLQRNFNIEYSCHTVTNIKHGRRLSLQLMTN